MSFEDELIGLRCAIFSHVLPQYEPPDSLLHELDPFDAYEACSIRLSEETLVRRPPDRLATSGNDIEQVPGRSSASVPQGEDGFVREKDDEEGPERAGKESRDGRSRAPVEAEPNKDVPDDGKENKRKDIQIPQNGREHQKSSLTAAVSFWVALLIVLILLSVVLLLRFWYS